jgi:hypothetical protein
VIKKVKIKKITYATNSKKIVVNRSKKLSTKIEIEVCVNPMKPQVLH